MAPIKLTLGPAPASTPSTIGPVDGDALGDLKVFGRPSAPVPADFEVAGEFFANWAKAQSAGSRAGDDNDGGDNDEGEADVDPLEGVTLVPIKQSYIDQNDPANWRNQDHYMLLGLQKYRYKATEDMIRAAFKIQTITHHPDKKSSNNWSEKDREQADGYFTCVKKAFEILGDKGQRRLYDSIDASEEDDYVPDKTKKPENFYKRYPAAFKRNMRWFHEELPELGDENSSKEHVDNFYEAWYNAQSWREFGYFDEEQVNDNDSREQKRWVEQQNKKARKRKQKEEKSRILRLLDNAVASDPRIKLFKAAAKEAKLAEAKAKKEAEEAKKKAEQEAAAAKAAVEEEAKKSASVDRKKAKEMIQRAKRGFVKACKRCGIYNDGYGAETEITEEQVTSLKTETPIETLQEWVKEKDPEAFAELVRDEIARREGRVREKKTKKAEQDKEWTQEEQAKLERALKEVPKDDPNRWDRIAGMAGRSVKAVKLRIKSLMAQAQVEKNAAPTQWTKEELSVVVKAASKVFPPGTCEVGGVDRWGQIAEYLKIHAHTTWTREKKDIIAAVNQAKNINEGLANKVNSSADITEVKMGRDKSVQGESVPSQRYD